MSTRSGKRIHSCHENILKPDVELGYRSEKKTRSKRVKENCEDVNVTLQKSKKRENYVSFPTDDESTGDPALAKEPVIKSTRSLRKNVLKEQNTTIPDIESLDSTNEPSKLVRVTRRTKKFSENASDDIPEVKNDEVVTLDAVEKPKTKKSKKKKEPLEQNTEEAAAPAPSRKSKRKKKKTSSNYVIDEVIQNNNKDDVKNQSNMSVDSFHSAAGSPIKINVTEGVHEEGSSSNIDLESKLNTKQKTTHNVPDVIISPSTSTNLDLSIHKKNNKTDKQKKHKAIKDITVVKDNETKGISNTDENEMTINKSHVKDSTFDKSEEDSTSGNARRKSSVTALNIMDNDFLINNVPQKRPSRRSSIKDNLTAKADVASEKDEEFVDNECSIQNGDLGKIKTSLKESDSNKTQDKDNELKSSKSRKRKSSIKDSSLILTFGSNAVANTFENQTEIEKTISSKRKSSIKDANLNSTPVITGEINTTYEKDSEVKPSSTRKRKSSIKVINTTFSPIVKEINTTYEKDSKDISMNNKSRKSSFKDSPISFTFGAKEIDTPIDIKSASSNDTTFDRKDSSVECLNSTFEKRNSSKRKSVINTEILNNTYDKSPVQQLNETSKKSDENSTFNKSSELNNGLKNKRKSIINVENLNNTYDKSPTPSLSETSKKSDQNSSFNKSSDLTDVNNGIKNKRKSIINVEILNNTYDKSPTPSLSETSKKSDQNSTFNKSKELKDTTFDNNKKLDSTFDKTNSKTSLLTSDSSNNGTIGNMSHVSITSDESTENIINTTPLLIESSMDDSQLTNDQEKAESPVKPPQTPLKREGTFTKETSDITAVSQTPTKRMSLPSPGCTPYLPRSANREKAVLNVTRSIEKSRRSSIADVAPRQTRVMFCSPVNNPGVVTQQKRKVIKSNLKGSNKSFVFEETESRPAPRKRSYTLGDADEARAKRTRLADDIQTSVDRLSRPRTSSASAKLEGPSNQHPTPSKTKPEPKRARTKLPNFAALHQRNFDKMESLDECQERKAKRAKQLLTPTAALTERTKGPSPEPQKDTKPQATPTKRFQTKLPSLDTVKPGFTRFGFKLNMDANPFTVPSKNAVEKPKEKRPDALKREATLPSLVGATSLRRENAKQLVLREKSFTGKREVKRSENRTVIKGVRTNRRFELQMKMRNIE